MVDDAPRVSVLIDLAGDDDIRTFDDTTSLAGDLRELDVHRVERASVGAAPPGTRSVDMASTGSLIVVAAASRVLLRSVLATVQDWLARRQSGTVSVKIDDDELILTYASKSDRTRAIDAFVARHAK